MKKSSRRGKKGRYFQQTERKHRQTEQIGKQSAMCNRAKQLRILRERRACKLFIHARRQNFPECSTIQWRNLVTLI